MANEIKIEGLEDVLARLEKVADKKTIKKTLGKACAKVERAAREKAPKGQGDLRRSITSEVREEGNEIIGVIFTPLEYAPYVEYGTGLFAEEGGKDGYWVYVKDSTIKSNKNAGKRYTLDEAKQIVAMMRADGLEAYYTNGRQATPFMRPALNENREEVKRIIAEGVTSNND